MAKNEPELDTKCPRCGMEAVMEVDIDLKLASNVTVLRCANTEQDGDGVLICDHSFAKDQSVKLSGSLVLEVALAMDIVGGYSGLGEFVRECVRLRTQGLQHQNNVEAYGTFLGAIAEDPDKWMDILSELNDDEEEE